jgi:hypothetical protein
LGLGNDRDFVDSFYRRPYLYQAQGYYHALLQPYFERFRRDQIHICLYDDLLAAPVAMLQDIFRFLGVDESFVPDVSARLMKSDPVQQPDGISFTPALKQKLTRVYYRDIEQLSTLIDRDLSCWLSGVTPQG